MNRILLIGCLFLFLGYSFQYAQTGAVKTYYPNGSVQSEISYINDIIDGSAIEYYQNGNVKSEKNYSAGVMNGNVHEFYPSGLLKEEYAVDHGTREGVARSFYDNGGLKSVCKYSQGKVVEITSFEFDPSHKAVPQDYLAGKNTEAVTQYNASSLCSADVCAEPIGGQNAIQANLIYPDHALRYGLEGTVTIRAIINIDGDVIATEILTGLGLGCDEAAEDAVKKTKFTPGKTGGQVIESSLTLNVQFKITAK